MMETKEQAPRGRKRPAKARPPRQAPDVEGAAYSDGREGWPDTMLYLREPPSANRWWRKFRGRMVLSAEAIAYKQHVSNATLVGKVRKIEKPADVEVSLFWYRGRKSGDLDKRIGILLDALQGCVYDNDSQVRRIIAERRDHKNAHAVVVHVTTLRPAPAGGET
jgi:Holliday junction resolvase RusA-like endonuclease